MDFSFTTVIIVILLIIIIYFVWTMLSSSSSVASTGHQDARSKTSINVPVNTSSFSFVTWLYVSEWSQTPTTSKNIVSNTGGTQDITRFNLSLDSNNNILNLSIGNGSTQPTSVQNIPLQTWVCIIVSVNNGNAVDIYLNGKLVSTTSLSATYSLPSGSYDVGGGITGLINVTFNPEPTGPQDAWNIYSSGDGSGTGSSVTDFFNKYKVRFAFVKDNVELSKLDI
jgi:hypothetical protein